MLAYRCRKLSIEFRLVHCPDEPETEHEDAQGKTNPEYQAQDSPRHRSGSIPFALNCTGPLGPRCLLGNLNRLNGRDTLVRACITSPGPTCYRLSRPVRNTVRGKL